MLNSPFLTLRVQIIATNINLIIGRPDIKSLNLVERFPVQFTIVDVQRRVLKRGGQPISGEKQANMSAQMTLHVRKMR